MSAFDSPEGGLAPAPANTRPSSSNDHWVMPPSNYQAQGLASYLENQCPLLTQILVRPRLQAPTAGSRLPEAATNQDSTLRDPTLQDPLL